MPLKLNEWVTVGSASQTKPVSTPQGTVNFTLTYYLEAMLTAQNVAQNKWEGKCRARVTRSGGSSYSSSMTASCSNCSSYSGVTTPPATLTSGTFTLYGNDAGESALHLVGILTAVVGGFSISVDAWMGAPTIPRASKPTFSTNPLTIGQTQTITTNRASSNFTHQLVLSLGDYSTTINDVGASVTWTPDSSLMEYMDTWQKTVTVTCTTYNGSTVIGSTTSSFVLQVDTSVYKPVITVGTLTDIGSTTSGLTNGTFIKGKSLLNAPIDVEPNDSGDAVATVEVTLGSTTQTVTGGTIGEGIAFVFQAITNTNELVIKATDQRGYTVTQTVTITLLEYSDIQIQSVEYARVNASNVETETGEYVRYTIKANAFLGSFGAVTNSITVTSESKLASVQTYGSSVLEKTVTTSGSGMGDITITGVTVGTYSPSSQYDIRFTLTDLLSSATATPLRIHEGVPVYAWGEDHFDIYGELHLHDREDVTKYIALGWDNPSTEAVTFSGAQGGSVNWNVFAYGSLRICTAKWSDASNRSCSTAWGGMYTCTRFDTPDYPVNFSAIHYENMQLIQADANANYSAVVIPQVGSTINLTSYGEVFLARGSNATIGHPIYVQIVVGTV